MAGKLQLRIYGDWTELFRQLSAGEPISREESVWRQAGCEGIAAVLPAFSGRLEEVINLRLNDAAKTCTRHLNEALAEGDLSLAELWFRRCDREWEACRFYRFLTFLPEDFRQELDTQVMNERVRYWREMEDFLTEAAEETGNEDIRDLQLLAHRLRKASAQAADER